MPFVLAAALMLGLFQIPQVVGGSVVDLHGRAVPGADVEADCLGVVSKTRTDRNGRFAISVDPAVPCSLIANKPGFDTVTQELGRGSDQRVVLAIAPYVERVVVSPRDTIDLPIGSASFTGEELQRVSNRTEDVIHAALLSSTGAAGSAVVYVDGFPAHALPRIGEIQTLTINAHPFSAEYGDGDVSTVNIVTQPAARRVRLAPGGSLPGFGGGDALREGARAELTSASLSASGPLPRLAASFSGNIRYTGSRNDVALEGVIPDGAPAGDAWASTAMQTNRIWAGGFAATYVAPTGPRVRLTYSGSQSTADNVGAGGLVTTSAAYSSRSANNSIQANLSVPRQHWLHEGGVLVARAAATLTANSERPGVSVAGHFVDGGAAISVQATERVGWTAKYVGRHTGRVPVTLGVVASGTANSQAAVPNPHGLLQFETAPAYLAALAGEPTGILLTTDGAGKTAHRNLHSAAFLQTVLLDRSRLRMEIGVRLDAQQQTGAVVSPRASLTSKLRGVVFEAGSGVFAQPISDSVFARALLYGPGQLSQSVGRTAVHSELSPDLSMPRQLLHRLAVERRFGPLAPSVEYRWSVETHRLGADRLEHATGWVDLLESRRRAERHQLHTRLLYRWRQQSLTGHYQWLLAADDADHPFSFPERARDTAAEWARSAGVSPHNITVSGTLTPGHGIYAMVTQTWQSSAPFNITSGVDTDGNGLFTERDGRTRNSGHAPGISSLDVSLSRRFTITRWLGRQQPLSVVFGARAMNLLDRRNWTGIGSVIGSPTFGQPISASGRRSVRFWFTIG